MKYFTWLLKAVIFFVLFAFALNNQEPVLLHLFFGATWQAPMVMVVLVTFLVGLFVGIAVMLPPWWTARQRVNASGTTERSAQQPTPSTHPDTPPLHTDGI